VAPELESSSPHSQEPVRRTNIPSINNFCVCHLTSLAKNITNTLHIVWSSYFLVLSDHQAAASEVSTASSIFVEQQWQLEHYGTWRVVGWVFGSNFSRRVCSLSITFSSGAITHWLQVRQMGFDSRQSQELYSPCPDRLWASTGHLSNGFRGTRLWGINLSEHQADNSHP
jgi:hypothetical protein